MLGHERIILAATRSVYFFSAIGVSETVVVSWGGLTASVVLVSAAGVIAAAFVASAITVMPPEPLVFCATGSGAMVAVPLGAASRAAF